MFSSFETCASKGARLKLLGEEWRHVNISSSRTMRHERARRFHLLMEKTKGKKGCCARDKRYVARGARALCVLPAPRIARIRLLAPTPGLVRRYANASDNKVEQSRSKYTMRARALAASACKKDRILLLWLLFWERNRAAGAPRGAFHQG